MSVKFGHSRREAKEMKEFNNTTRSGASGPKDRIERLLHGETNSSYTSANFMSHQRKDGEISVARSTHKHKNLVLKVK